MRKTIVLVLGFSIVALGLALIVLPGPFTLPLLILGFFILGTEFVWAATILAKTREQMEKAGKLVRKVTGKEKK